MLYISCCVEIPTRLETKETKKKSGKNDKQKIEARLNKVFIVDVRTTDEYPFHISYFVFHIPMGKTESVKQPSFIKGSVIFLRKR